MKRPCLKVTSSLLCLTTAWSAQVGVWAQGNGADQVSTQPKFAAAKAVLDTTPTPRLKPFTLGASEVTVKTQAQDDSLKSGAAAGQDDPLKADSNFTLDPFNRPLTSGVNTNRFNLNACQIQRLLSRYNVELLVDRSQSMNKRDCPGGLSRWQWCGEQAAGLAKTISPLVPQGLTIVPFATEYDVFDHATADNIAELFNTMRLQFGTRLYEPMAEQFDTYFANHTPGKKPLLVVVITDGCHGYKVEPAPCCRNFRQTPAIVTKFTEAVIFCVRLRPRASPEQYSADLDQTWASCGARPGHCPHHKF